MRKSQITSGLSTIICAKTWNPWMATDSGAELLHLILDPCRFLVQNFRTQNSIFHLCKWLNDHFYFNDQNLINLSPLPDQF